MGAIDDARQLVEARLADLDEERGKLERALAELGGTGKPKRRGRGPGRPKGVKAAAKASGAPTKKRRARAGGSRGDQAVALVEKQPGISASEIASKLKIKPNYLYRVMNEMVADGRVKKDGRAYHPVAA